MEEKEGLVVGCVSMVWVDIGGHPPIPLGPPPLFLSFFQFH